ncbi:MAG: dockerin type I domain-containing protein [bacterium]|nr:dockerin type I domain-containing protein [bacterium]
MRKILFASLLVLALSVMPTVAGAQTMADLQALIAQLQAQIALLTAQLNQQTGSCKVLVAHDVSFGDEDNAADKTVTALQKYLERQGYLNMPAGAQYGFFGRITLAAAVAWQKANSVINNGVSETDASGFAYIGSASRQIINQCANKPIPTPVPLVPVPLPLTSDILGDVNGNGGIDMDDARLATAYYLGQITLDTAAKRRADVTQNGQVSSDDALCITSKYFGRPSCLDIKTGSLGDVDANGSIVMEDARLTTEHYLGYILLRRDQQERADVTKDGTITSADALCITNKYFGRPSCLDDNQTSISPLTVTSPNGGESWQKGTMQAIKWQTPVPSCPVGAFCSSPAPKYYDIQLATYYPPCNANINICPAYPYMAPYTIAKNVYGSTFASYSWSVGKVLDTFAPDYSVPSGSYTVQVCQAGTRICDNSDSYFKIIDSNSQPSITVTSPNGGESWQKGTTQTIKWQTPGSDCGSIIASCIAPTPKYYDIQLATYYPPCTGDICPAYPYRSPYTIAKSVYGSTFASYSWTAGKVLDLDGGLVPVGQYTVQVCETGTNTCDASDSYFKIYDITTTNQPPVITGLTAPTSLVMRGTSSDTGTWVVKAYDPEGGALSYIVDWGDTSRAPISDGYTSVSAREQQSTFTHSYSQVGSYKVTITVSDNTGQNAQTSATVQVGSITTTQPSITVTSPNGGESLTLGNNVVVTWSATGAESFPGADLQLIDSNGNVVSSSRVNPISGTQRSDNLSTNGLVAGKYLVKACLSGNIDICDSSNNYFTLISDVPSLKASLKVTVLNGGIQCFTTPCEFPLAGAQVTVYDASKILVGNQTVGSDGVANFANLNPGTYSVYASATNYNKSAGSTIGLVSGQAGSLKISVYPSTSKLPLSSVNDSQLAAVLQSLQSSLNLLKGAVGY